MMVLPAVVRTSTSAVIPLISMPNTTLGRTLVLGPLPWRNRADRDHSGFAPAPEGPSPNSCSAGHVHDAFLDGLSPGRIEQKWPPLFQIIVMVACF
jgi:hypothetical protein